MAVVSSTPTRVATGASAPILATNARRKTFMLYNEGPGSLYIKLGSTVSVTDFLTILVSGAFFELTPGSNYQGVVSGFSSVAGFVQVTELST